MGDSVADAETQRTPQFPRCYFSAGDRNQGPHCFKSFNYCLSADKSILEDWGTHPGCSHASGMINLYTPDAWRVLFPYESPVYNIDTRFPEEFLVDAHSPE